MSNEIVCKRILAQFVYVCAEEPGSVHMCLFKNFIFEIK